MNYTVTISLLHLLWIAFFIIIFYVYIKDDGNDRLTQMRHDIEVRKEWFRMLAEQKKNNPKWPAEWAGEKSATSRL